MKTNYEKLLALRTTNKTIKITLKSGYTFTGKIWGYIEGEKLDGSEFVNITLRLSNNDLFTFDPVNVTELKIINEWEIRL